MRSAPPPCSPPVGTRNHYALPVSPRDVALCPLTGPDPGTYIGWLWIVDIVHSTRSQCPIQAAGGVSTPFGSSAHRMLVLNSSAPIRTWQNHHFGVIDGTLFQIIIPHTTRLVKRTFFSEYSAKLWGSFRRAMTGRIFHQIWGFTLVFSARYGPCYWLTGLSACPHTFAVYSSFRSSFANW